MTRRFHQSARPTGDIRFTHFVQNTYKPSVFFTALTNSATPTYDANGNTKTMSGATFEYDQKNQLKSVSGLDTNSQMVTVTHSYDSMGRRISSTKNTQTTIFAYDGWNVVEEYNSTTPATPIKIHTWGIDLSGSAQGAGGVGGLLFTEDLVTNTAWHHHYDGNGNVTHLTNAAAQGVGIYTYDAFGNTVTATGTAATINKYRFSTKPLDEEIANTPLYYYGYRYYTPLTGRWINRDPIGEIGGLNLYGFVYNNAVNTIDKLGLVRIVNKSHHNMGQESNCLGGAITGNGTAYLFPDERFDKEVNFIQAMDKIGFTCRQVESKEECDCENCEEWYNRGEFKKRKILITAYRGTKKGGNRGKNPWTDPTYKWDFGNNSDLHAISMDFHGFWTQITEYQPKKQDFNEDIEWFLFTDTPLLCCCPKDKD